MKMMNEVVGIDDMSLFTLFKDGDDFASKTKMLKIRHARTRRRSNQHSVDTRNLAWKTPPMRREKTTGSSQRISLYRDRLQTLEIYNDWLM